MDKKSDLGITSFSLLAKMFSRPKYVWAHKHTRSSLLLPFLLSGRFIKQVSFALLLSGALPIHRSRGDLGWCSSSYLVGIRIISCCGIFECTVAMTMLGCDSAEAAVLWCAATCDCSVYLGSAAIPSLSYGSPDRCLESSSVFVCISNAKPLHYRFVPE